MNNKKIELVKQHIDILDNMLFLTKKSIEESQEEANYHIGAMQSRYDTFKEEAQYLVDAQKIRLFELNEQYFTYKKLLDDLENKKISNEKLAVGNLCVLSNETDLLYFFILPMGLKGGVVHNNVEYTAISYQAPIISPFIGKEKLDYGDIEGHKLEDYFILDIL